MKNRATSLSLIPLLAVAWTVFAAAELRAQRVLDPQPDYEELNAEAAVHPGGDVLLTWTRWSRQQERGAGWSVMAATLDPNSGQFGELHEWGPGGAMQVVPLGSGYLAVRQSVNPNEWFMQRLDETGEPVGAALPLGFPVILSVAAQATPDGGAVVVAGGAGGNGGPAQAWRFGPDGALLAGPVQLVDASGAAAFGVDGAGNLVLAWTEARQVFVRRFSPDLQPLDAAVPVTPRGASGLGLAVAPDGRFVVVFNQSYQLRTRAFHADGTPAGETIRISPQRDLVVDDFSVATGPDGEILVVWKTYANLNVPTIQARFLSFNGRPTSPLLRLAKVPIGRNVLSPRVETLPEGDFLVVWTQVLDTAGNRLILRSRRVSH